MVKNNQPLLSFHFSDTCLKLLASVFHIVEEVEAGATGAEEHRVARLGHFRAGFHAVGHIVRVGHGKTEVVEIRMQFGIVAPR